MSVRPIVSSSAVMLNWGLNRTARLAYLQSAWHSSTRCTESDACAAWWGIDHKDTPIMKVLEKLVANETVECSSKIVTRIRHRNELARLLIMRHVQHTVLCTSWHYRVET